MGIISTPPPIPMMPVTTPVGIPQAAHNQGLSLGLSVTLGGLAVSILIPPVSTTTPKAIFSPAPGRYEAIVAPEFIRGIDHTPTTPSSRRDE